jgi:formylglycine-generating enzyme required for sulfatase activity
MAYRAYCVLIPIYAYGSEGFEKNLDKVIEYSQKAAVYSSKFKVEEFANLNKERACIAAQLFIQPIVDDAKKIAEAAALAKAKSAGPLKKFKDCPDCPEMVDVPEGEFEMGHQYENHQTPIHKVTISKRFAIGKTEVTRGQFKAFVKATKYEVGLNCDAGHKSKFELSWQKLEFMQDDNHPVVCVSLVDAKAYAEWLSKKTKKNYQIPTEAQWEYACKAGQEFESCGGKLYEVAWYGEKGTQPVAKMKANSWGAFDMNGNAAEWVLDPYHDNYIGAPTDGSLWAGNSPQRILRGGSWDNASGSITSTHRGNWPVDNDQIRYSTAGFRVVQLTQ